MDKIPSKEDVLNSACRQYRHNTESVPGFVFGYDKEIIEAALDALYNEIERLRRVERAAMNLVDECRTLTGTLWPQNQTTKMLARVLDEFDLAALEEK